MEILGLISDFFNSFEYDEEKHLVLFSAVIINRETGETEGLTDLPQISRKELLRLCEMLDVIKYDLTFDREVTEDADTQED